MKYLLDTNVLRELGKTTPHSNVSAWIRTVDDQRLDGPRDYEGDCKAEAKKAWYCGRAVGINYGYIRCI